MNNFAQAWVDAWNSHDLEAIMEHYADDVVFYSPFIQKLNNDPTGRIQGKEGLRAYFAKGLEAYPDLHFELYHVLEGIQSAVLYYKSVNNRLSAEMMVLNEAGKVVEVRAHYKQQ
jgi:ketosteroid isomerase-like protein